MKISLHKDSRGLAPLAIVAVVAAVLVIGGVGYLVFAKDKDKDGTSSSVVANSEAEKACNDLYDDKDLCKFASRYSAQAASKTTFTITGADGKVTTMNIDSDGKGNTSSVTKDGNTEVSAFISLDGNTYLKNTEDGTWTKFPKNDTTTETSAPTEDLKIDFEAEAAKPADQRDVYKKVGKEACGDRTCYKYEFTQTGEGGGKHFIWFDTKDYQLRQWEYSDAEGNKNVAVFEYTDVTISVPSPVTDAPSVPTEADIQQYLNQAQ